MVRLYMSRCCLIVLKLFSFGLPFFYFSLISYASASIQPDTVSADSIEHDAKTGKYIARGSVELKTADFVIKADEIIYFRESAEVEAAGNVRYEDNESAIRAARAFFNTEARTGRLFDAEISSRRIIQPPGDKDESRKKEAAAPTTGEERKHEVITYHIYGKEIEKRGEQDYHATDARITTCDAPLPAWCLSGKDVTVQLGDSMTAKQASLKIKNVPVLYTPYLWAPIATERKTGFLVPSAGYSESRGYNINIPYYWAIAENRDATFILDIYSKRGVGAAVEYRFVKPGGISSSWWVYHIRDTELKKDYWETKIVHENRSAGKIGGFVNINHVNEKDFYREYSTHIQTRAQRFLESTAELQMPMSNSRLYLLSQYWVDLKQDAEDVPHRLPELGYILHDLPAGPFLLSGLFTASNIWRENGLSARRADLSPGVSHSFGQDFVVSQKANLRATLYSFFKDSEEDETTQRTFFEYDTIGHTRFFRKYAAFTHIVEPGIRYHYITNSKSAGTVFDSAEIFGKTSRFELTFLNRFMAGGREMMSFRLAQGLDTYNGDRPFLPLTLEASMTAPFPLKLNASYDVNEGRLETVTSELAFKVYTAMVTLGERYNRAEDVLQFRTGMVMDLGRTLQLAGGLWYDAKESRITDMRIGLRYMQQCWGLMVEYEKKPDDYSFSIMYELTGLVSNISRKIAGNISAPLAGDGR